MSKPIVDGLEADLKGKIGVLRIDMLSEMGRNSAALYGVRAVPTILVVDGDGSVVTRSTGIPDRGALADTALALLTP